MTDLDKLEAAEYYIISRGLYFRPDAQGYTGIRDEAGLYTKSEADKYEAQTVHKDEAPEFLPNAYSDLVIKHLVKQRDAARAHLAAQRQSKPLPEFVVELEAKGYGPEIQKGREELAGCIAQRQGGIGKPVQYTDGSDSREYEVHPPAVTGDRGALDEAIDHLCNVQTGDESLRIAFVKNVLCNQRAALLSAQGGVPGDVLSGVRKALLFYADDGIYIDDYGYGRSLGGRAKEALTLLQPYLNNGRGG